MLADGTSGLHEPQPLPAAVRRSRRGSPPRAARPNGDFALVLRSGAMGAQRFQSAQWNGDAVMRWQGPDGLKSMVPAALSFGLSGFPYWHTEVAGYVQADLSHDQERELWLRWLQLATWTSLLRDHLGDQPRSPIDVWLDDGTVSAFRHGARASTPACCPTCTAWPPRRARPGVPLMRFLPMEAPDDPRAWQEEQSYFLGPHFLVAPVVDAWRDHAHGVSAAGRMGRLLARDAVRAAARKSRSRRRSTAAARPSSRAPGRSSRSRPSTTRWSPRPARTCAPGRAT